MTTGVRSLSETYGTRARAALAALLVAAGCAHAPAADGEYWPGEDWRRSSPEAQGLDGEKIDQLAEVIAENDRLHSLVIVRHGYVVTERSFHGAGRDTREDVVSTVDAIVSALVGIAIEDGAIPGLDARLDQLLDVSGHRNPSAAKAGVTVADLLTMSSGLGWPWRLDPANLGLMMRAPDATGFFLDQPATGTTHRRFNYSAGNSQLLSAILTRATGVSAARLAEERLFGPMGIRGAEWRADATGVNAGAYGLSLRPLDLARFGYLYLHGGRWNGRQLVPARWVAESTAPRIGCHYYPYDDDAYGLGWWIEPFGFSAKGWSGNHLFVLPAHDMVIVVTAESRYFRYDPAAENPASFSGEMRDGPTKKWLSAVIQSLVLAHARP